MGARGPVPKPGELKVLEGGRGHRPIDLTSTFRPEAGIPDAPRWLTKEARKAWKRLSVELNHYNLLSRVDREAFAMLCQTIGRLELVEQSFNGRIAQLLAEGKDPASAYTGTTPNGMVVQSALYQVLNREQSKLSSLLAEFGLTPAQRARVTTAIRAQLTLFDANKAEGAPAKPSDGFAGFE